MTAASKPVTLAAALVAAQKDMPAVEPDATNPHFKSKFVSLDHLIAKTRPVLNKHGLAISQAPTHIDGQPALETTIHHEGGEMVTSTMPLLLGGSDMQKLGAALTYARRYAWAAALGISADEDDDGNSAAQAASKPAAKAGSQPKTAGDPDVGTPAVTPKNGTPSEQQVAEIENLIAGLNASNILTEIQVRDGMKQSYGTEVTRELSAVQADELVRRLAAKVAVP